MNQMENGEIATLCSGADGTEILQEWQSDFQNQPALPNLLFYKFQSIIIGVKTSFAN